MLNCESKFAARPWESERKKKRGGGGRLLQDCFFFKLRLGPTISYKKTFSAGLD